MNEYHPIQRTITTPSEATPLSRWPLRRGFLLMPIAIALAWIALLPTAQASSYYSYNTFTFMYQNIQRFYQVHIPNSYSLNHATPVVMYLHGGGSNMTEADQITYYSEKYGFILLAPQGTQQGSSIGYTWNAGTTTVDGVVLRVGNPNIDDVGYIAQVISQIELQYNIDPKHIYATGFSNGGAMANRLGCELSTSIAAIAPVAASMEDACAPGIPAMPDMLIHGTGDLCHPYNGGDNFPGCAPGILTPVGSKFNFASAPSMNLRWISIDACSGTQTTTYQNGAATCVTNPSCASSSQVTFCTVTGMGHTYPNGAQYLDPSLIGPVSHDISFDQIWAFFTQFSLP
ncbi:MAG: PHB depolymerase family esterase [Methylocella sp.]